MQYVNIDGILHGNGSYFHYIKDILGTIEIGKFKYGLYIRKYCGIFINFLKYNDGTVYVG